LVNRVLTNVIIRIFPDGIKFAQVEFDSAVTEKIDDQEKAGNDR
jgi:hypothetical protein